MHTFKYYIYVTILLYVTIYRNNNEHKTMTFKTYKARHKIVTAIRRRLAYYDNRYKLTLPTRTFIIIISAIGLLNSPLIPCGAVLNPFLDKIIVRWVL